MTSNQIEHYEVHHLAELIPPMTEEEFKDLKADMEKNGQLEPIILFQEKVLDGRHRYRACRELGIQPIVCERDFNGMSLPEIIRSLNIHRRHLSASQRSMLAVNFLEIAEKHARERQREGGRQGGGGTCRDQNQVQEKFPELNNTGKQATDVVAEEFGVSGRSVRDAKVVKQKGSIEEQQQVIDGKQSVSSVAKKIRKQQGNKELKEGHVSPKDPSSSAVTDRSENRNDFSDLTPEKVLTTISYATKQITSALRSLNKLSVTGKLLNDKTHKESEDQIRLIITEAREAGLNV